MSVNQDVLGAAVQAVTDAARSGQSMRASANGLAYGLAGSASIAAQCSTVEIDAKTYHALVVTDSGTPVTTVNEGAAKPNAIVTAGTSVDLVKHAGYASVSLESLTYYDETRRVITDVLWRQAVRSLDSAIVTAMAAAATVVVSADASPSVRVIAALAKAIDDAATPTAVVVNPADWAAIVSENDGGQYLNMASGESGPTGTFMGCNLVPASAVPAKTAYVFDSSAVVVAHHKDAPMLFLGAMDTSNKANLIIDLLAAPLVTLPKGVAKVALP